nr:MAG TPA: hypothetical protein [Caudoviricetes sp.]
MDIKRIGERAHMRAAASAIRGMYCMVEEIDRLADEVGRLTVENGELKAECERLRGRAERPENGAEPVKTDQCGTRDETDRWERLAEDSQMTPSRYCERYGIEPLLGGKVCAMMADIVARARELGEAGEEDE